MTVHSIHSSVSIDDEKMDQNNTSEEISSHQNSAEIIDHKCDDNGFNLLNTEEEAGVTSINSINGNNDISMNDDKNYIHKYYAPFLSSKDHEYEFSGPEYDSAKQTVHRQKKIVWIYY